MTPEVADTSFRRDDRDQLTQLANAHVQSVVSGLTVSTNRILSQLEREPGEFIVDPWVAARRTAVAEQRGRVSAAAHLLVYGDGPEVGTSYRGLGDSPTSLDWLTTSACPPVTVTARLPSATGYACGVHSGRPAPGCPLTWTVARLAIDDGSSWHRRSRA